ncbi:MAG: hypothetical protein QM756_08715 [Polyangiaceae bacterium]
MRLRFATRAAEQAPVDHGFGVTRALLDAKTGAPVTNPTLGQLLKVRVTITTAALRQQVALVDMLPAGFEAVDSALATSAAEPNPSQDSVVNYEYSPWVHRELHDERVTHFADALSAGKHVAEYLVRATRKGTFLRPAASAEMMYAPEVFGHGALESVNVH